MKKEIALALGGGGIKGVAHIGVLKRLDELGFTIKAIAGTSAGALVGSMYCAGISPDEISEAIKGVNQSKIFSYHNDGPGLLSLHTIAQVMVSQLKDRAFSDLKIKFACPAVDILSAKEYVFQNKPVIDSVIASSSVPGIFPPKIIDGKEFVDGAVKNPVPVSIVRWLEPGLPILAVSLSRPDDNVLPPEKLSVLPTTSPIPAPIVEQFSKLRIAQAFSIFSRSIDLSSIELAELRMAVDKPDTIIRPDVNRFGMFDKFNPDELIQIGITAVDESLPMIEQSLSPIEIVKRKFIKPIPPVNII